MHVVYKYFYMYDPNMDRDNEPKIQADTFYDCLKKLHSWYNRLNSDAKREYHIIFKEYIINDYNETSRVVWDNRNSI